MNTLHLKYIAEVEKTGSISKAAENLYMNQPHLSKAIKELEESIGISIFKRTSKGVIPTTKGAEFIMYAKGILAQIERLESLFDPKKSGIITVEAAAARAEYISAAFSKLLAESDGNDKIRFSYRETNSLRVIKNVATGEDNIGIVRFRTENERYFMQMLEEKELKSEALWDFYPKLLVSENSPLADKETVTQEELLNLTEVVYGDNSVPFIQKVRAKENAGAEQEKKRVFIYERAGMYDALINDALAYAYISPPPVGYYTSLPLLVKDVSHGALCRDLIIYRSEYSRSETDKTFIDMLRKEIKGIESRCFV